MNRSVVVEPSVDEVVIIERQLAGKVTDLEAPGADRANWSDLGGGAGQESLLEAFETERVTIVAVDGDEPEPKGRSPRRRRAG